MKLTQTPLSRLDQRRIVLIVAMSVNTLSRKFLVVELTKLRLILGTERDTNGCWIWKKCMQGNGYGQLCFNERMRPASRVSAAVFLGFDIDSKLIVCHKCDVKACCNPEHLFIGTHKDNIQDCVKKNRIARGQRNGNTKLTEDNVLEIRSLLSSGEPIREIARKFSTSCDSIRHISTGRTWSHLR